MCEGDQHSESQRPNWRWSSQHRRSQPNVPLATDDEHESPPRFSIIALLDNDDSCGRLAALARAESNGRQL